MMIPYEHAQQLIADVLGPLGTEEVLTVDCAGRVLAEEVTAQLDSPPFNKAAMDGYAVRADDVRNLPVELDCVGESRAGVWPDFSVGPGQCAGITTGAPVPDGSDVVIMVEHTERPGNGNTIRIHKLSGRNICDAGEDVAAGDTVLHPGDWLTPIRLGVAAASGRCRLTVYRRPTIALICTGTEVVEPGEPTQPSQIYNSNGPLLGGLLSPLAEEFRYLGIAGDQEDVIEATLTQGLKNDLLIVTGGVSVGPYDLVPGLLERLGVTKIFSKCAIKPGKPVFFGRRGETTVFGVPGNPFSGFVTFHALMRDAIARLCGARDMPTVFKTGRVHQSFENHAGRKHFRPCRAWVEDGAVLLELVPSRGSADITGGSAANALLVVPRDVSHVDAGASLEYLEV